MHPRIDYGKASPNGLSAMLGMERHVHASGLNATLIDLMKMRAPVMGGWRTRANSGEEGNGPAGWPQSTPRHPVIPAG